MDLTHVDASNQPRMVDVGEKTVTRRMAPRPRRRPSRSRNHGRATGR